MTKKSVEDHALAVVKAGLNAVPMVGGVLGSLISDYVPTSTQRAIEKTVALLAEQLMALQGRIDVELVDKEEFSELFKSCYLVAVRSHREEKLRAAAALLANLLLRPGDPSKASYEELDHLARCVEALSVGAISVLGAAHRMTSSDRSSGREETFLFPQLSVAFRQFDASMLMSLVRELQSLNLIRVQEGGIRIPDHGEVRLEMTPLGHRLIERFIEGNM